LRLIRRSIIRDPIAAYDAFAPHYATYAEARRPYLTAVENIIVSRAEGARSLLDAGSGDGTRALRISALIKPRILVLVEPSAAMRALCDARCKVLPCRASQIPFTTGRFDVITCLWNVLGHVQGADQRRKTLRRLKNLLNPGGSIFIDVCHRYNAAAYGWPKTLLRMARDTFFPSEKNGDAVISWKANQRTITTLGHAFTHSELERLFVASALEIQHRWVVNYETGAECNHSVLGHFVFELKAINA
jgi:SAM-dependent methyltransferase